MGDLLGLFGPAVLAILCVVAAARVYRERRDNSRGSTPAAAFTADEALGPDGVPADYAPPDDYWACGDLARALRSARRRRRQ